MTLEYLMNSGLTEEEAYIFMEAWGCEDFGEGGKIK